MYEVKRDDEKKTQAHTTLGLRMSSVHIISSLLCGQCVLCGLMCDCFWPQSKMLSLWMTSRAIQCGHIIWSRANNFIRATEILQLLFINNNYRTYGNCLKLESLAKMFGFIYNFFSDLHNIGLHLLNECDAIWHFHRDYWVLKLNIKNHSRFWISYLETQLKWQINK